MRNVSIKIHGTVGGAIWQPGFDHCSKDFHAMYRPAGRSEYRFDKEWAGLRKALLDITNDGDFQSCGIVEATMIIRVQVAPSVIKEHWIELTPEDPRIADLFVKNPEDFFSGMEWDD